jgi:carbohydrate binding protein with CBM11 domain
MNRRWILAVLVVVVLFLFVWFARAPGAKKPPALPVVIPPKLSRVPLPSELPSASKPEAALLPIEPLQTPSEAAAERLPPRVTQISDHIVATIEQTEDRLRRPAETGGVSVQTFDGLILADFNQPSPNNVGGAFGTFSPEDEKVFVCLQTPDQNEKHGNSGQSLRLAYDVTSPGSYNGFWMRLGSDAEGGIVNGSAYRALSFWIKPDADAGIPAKFKVELKDGPGKIVSKKYIGAFKTDWQKIVIPLTEFSSQGLDLKSLGEFDVVFEQRAASPGTKGAIWIDDIALEK